MLSLLLCLVSAWYWKRSYEPMIFLRDGFRYDHGDTNIIGYSSRGQVCLVLEHNPTAVPTHDFYSASTPVNVADLRPSFFETVHRFLGFGWEWNGHIWSIRGATF